MQDKKAETQWRKASISFNNYKKFIESKKNKFDLSLIDLLYISNFKGGNASIHEDDFHINQKLCSYSSQLKLIDENYKNKILAELNNNELQSLIDRVAEICNLTEGESKIDGFSSSYLSALLNSYFPALIPILDRRILINLKLVTENDLDSQKQVKNIKSFYSNLILKLANESRISGKTIRELDKEYFTKKL